MAKIVILEHQLQQNSPDQYLVYVMAQHWQRDGHRVALHRSLEDPPEGDLAILHVDLTVVPDEYLSLCAHFPRVVNGAVGNVSKSSFSQNLVGRESDWPGEVVVKTDRNAAGHPERAMRARARAAGLDCDIPGGPIALIYRVYPRIEDVPASIWSTPGLIVEKFLPEHDSKGFYMRSWAFFGDRERSRRFRSADPIIKGSSSIDNEVVPVPDEMRTWRERLKFDCGKFDYVCCNGQFILLDVNKTPNAPTPLLSGNCEDLAKGLGVFLGP